MIFGNASRRRPLQEQLRFLWARYLQLEGADALRRTMNRALLWMIVGLCVGIALSAVLMVDLYGSAMYLVGGILAALCAIPTRCGTQTGAWLLVGIAVIGNAVGFLPEPYVGPPIAVHTLFLFPSVIAVLTIGWSTGFVVVPLTVAALVMRAVTAGIPLPAVIPFAEIATLDLMPVNVPLMMLSAGYGRVVRDRVAANAHLERRVAELEAAIRQRDQVLHAVAHDLRKGIQMIELGLAGMLDRARLVADDAAIQAEDESLVASGMRAVYALADDLRTVALLRKGTLTLKYDAVDLPLLAAQVARAAQPQAEHVGCRLTVTAAPALPPVACDARRVERVLANLIDNAVKYTGGKMVDASVGITMASVADGIEVVIADNGRGMTVAELEQIGQPFARFDPVGSEGMGLGVYLSRGVVEQHRGQLTFASSGRGSGTTVTLWLPFAPQAVEEVHDGR